MVAERYIPAMRLPLLLVLIAAGPEAAAQPAPAPAPPVPSCSFTGGPGPYLKIGDASWFAGFVVGSQSFFRFASAAFRLRSL